MVGFCGPAPVCASPGHWAVLGGLTLREVHVNSPAALLLGSRVLITGVVEPHPGSAVRAGRPATAVPIFVEGIHADCVIITHGTSATVACSWRRPRNRSATGRP